MDKGKNSVADPEGFDADPDPTFQADADPDPNPFTRVRNFSTIVSKVFQNLSCVIFSARMREEG